MKTTTASATAILLACIAGCSAPASSGVDDATFAPSSLRTEAMLPLPPPPPAVTASVLFSEAGNATQTYPASSTTTFVDGEAGKIVVWAYLDNLAAGVHIAWIGLTNPAGKRVATIPVALATTLANATSSGYEVQAIVEASQLKVKKVIPNGTYTVTVTMNDAAVPALTDAPIGSGTFVFAGPV